MKRTNDEQFLHDWVIRKLKEKYISGVSVRTLILIVVLFDTTRGLLVRVCGEIGVIMVRGSVG